MLLLFSILGGLALLALLLLFIPTVLGVDYLLENKEQALKIRCRLLGIPFSFRVPLERQEEPKTQDAEKEEKKSLSPKKYIAYGKELYRAYREVEEEFRAVFRQIKERFACKELYFTVHYGTNNPVTTGMLNAGIWTASTLILKVLDSALGVQKKTLKVYPDFQKACMCIHMKGTFSFTLFDAIRFVLKIIKLVKLVKSHITTEI